MVAAGFALFTGTLFAPTQDRDAEGLGFTHKDGDRVTISSPQLGTLINRTERTEEMQPWTYGITALFNYLAQLESTPVENETAPAPTR
jgi:fumarylacetoacetate (FAA) hydrolase family protein